MLRADAPLLERVGVRYVLRLSRSLPRVGPDAAIHVLDARERAEINRIERAGVVRSALAGALSALIAVVGVWLADERFAVPEEGGLLDHAVYWGVVFGIGGVAAVFEVVFLYRDALRHALLMARAAGLPLFDEDDASVDAEIAGSIVRAALELDNKQEAGRLGINPLREASKWRLLLYSLLYKGKIAVTSFLLKLVIRRAMGRAAVRGAVIELVAVPVTAAWNAVVTWLVLRETRLRIMGPSAAASLVDELWARAPASPQRSGALRAVASAIVRSSDLHPNIVALLVEVEARAEGEEPEALDDTERFVEEFRAADAEHRRWLYAVAVLAAILDGRIAPAEKALLRELRGILGLDPAVAAEALFPG